MNKQTIKTGDIVNWSGGWGKDPAEPAKITTIQLCETKNAKYGKEVLEVLANKKDYCCFTLDNGHWAYGFQIEII